MRDIGQAFVESAAGAAIILAVAACLLCNMPIARGAECAGQAGRASWYQYGSRTASGERFRPDGISAAHRSLPFGSSVRVTDRATGRSIVVRISDRGPYVRGRVIDLSRGAARKLGTIRRGVVKVCVERVR